MKFLEELSDFEKQQVQHFEETQKQLPKHHCLLADDSAILEDDKPIPASLFVCTLWLAKKPEACKIAYTEVGDLTISTVFVCSPTAWKGNYQQDSKPCYFETMVISGQNSWKWTYFTKEEALAGHEKAKLEAM